MCCVWLMAIHYFRIASMTKIDCVDQVDNQQTVRNQRKPCFK
ncbi:hypothetical protein HMPREF1613_04060 [Escherichia coli 908616]|nr:hypothetical protein HMPREF9552_03312 [Escherichia coli MS 198-1]ESA79524.1 hypothetical protein HMPREF1599_05089 [Escherichia coli 907713]ESD20306.1 hypothetical protein HMPREF1600_04598 [Escherichia coli 907715]ESD49428.1 hypothetical protein HMPREF1605_03864 [Escherichia coli 908521]ESD84322.1 hypothetical protein HMPREF1613_04060 [Escherichia coli 908616]ESD85257.1 hypothetical protein HMPREF1612_03726 [Escherichia coli 908585]